VIGLVGVTGFAGAGKTTAVSHLSTLTGGRIFYLGKDVRNEVRARGLPETPESERQVRIDLRRENGPAALAIPHLDEVAECLGNGAPALVDAIFTQEEFDLLRSRVPKGPACVLAISASFAIRQARLACRSERTFSAEQLRQRDKYELENLRTDAVIASAAYIIVNEQTREEFYSRLAEFVSRCA
jgi:dephospho-CoA kinase